MPRAGEKHFSASFSKVLSFLRQLRFTLGPSRSPLWLLLTEWLQPRNDPWQVIAVYHIREMTLLTQRCLDWATTRTCSQVPNKFWILKSILRSVLNCYTTVDRLGVFRVRRFIRSFLKTRRMQLLSHPWPLAGVPVKIKPISFLFLHLCPCKSISHCFFCGRVCSRFQVYWFRRRRPASPRGRWAKAKLFYRMLPHFCFCSQVAHDDGVRSFDFISLQIQHRRKNLRNLVASGRWCTDLQLVLAVELNDKRYGTL